MNADLYRRLLQVQARAHAGSMAPIRAIVFPSLGVALGIWGVKVDRSTRADGNTMLGMTIDFDGSLRGAEFYIETKVGERFAGTWADRSAHVVPTTSPPTL